MNHNIDGRGAVSLRPPATRGRSGIRRVVSLGCAAMLGAAMLVTGSTGAIAAGTGQPDSAGTEFWIAFPKNHDSTPELTLFISAPRATTGTVASAAFADIPFSVAPGTVTSVVVPPEAQLNVDSGTKEDKGIHVTAGDDVTVYGLNRIIYTTDAFLALPTDVLDTEYLAMSYTPLSGYYPGQVSVVGAADGTTVTITPTAATLSGHAAGAPFDVALDAGETYVVESVAGDLTGTLVTATKDVAVFGGHRCVNVPVGYGACDHLVEQMPGTSTWGKDFLTVPLKTRLNGDTFRVLAAQDNTAVSVDGTPVATLTRGGFHEMVLDKASRISADKPILVAQYSNGSDFDGVTSDPFMMLVPPKEQYLASYVFATPATGFQANFVNVVAPTAAVGSVTVDGSPVAAGSFTPIGDTLFSWAQVDLTAGSHVLTSGQPVSISVYGFDSYDSYGYPGGASYAPVSQVTGLALTPPTTTSAPNLEVCLTSTVTDQGGQPLQGIRVDVTRTGVNPGTGFGFTDVSGISRHCYTGTALGTDTVKATVGTLSATATVIWATPVVTPKPPVTTPPVTTPPVTTPPVAPKLDTKTSAVSGKSKFKLQVLTPCEGQFSFRVQKRYVTTIPQGSDEPLVKVTWKKLPKTYKTAGAAQTKTINLSKGKYRAVVTGKCGFVKTTTKSVTLKK